MENKSVLESLEILFELTKGHKKSLPDALWGNKDAIRVWSSFYDD